MKTKWDKKWGLSNITAFLCFDSDYFANKGDRKLSVLAIFTDKSKQVNHEINIARSSNALVDITHCTAMSSKLMSGSLSNLIPTNQTGNDVYSLANVRGGHLPPMFIRSVNKMTLLWFNKLWKKTRFVKTSVNDEFKKVWCTICVTDQSHKSFNTSNVLSSVLNVDRISKFCVIFNSLRKRIRDLI